MSRNSGFAIAVVLLLFKCALAQDSSEKHANEQQAVAHVEQLDTALADLIDKEASIEVLSTGHQWTEGPVWIKSEGYLLFSDVPQNKIHKWSPTGERSVFMDPSGYDGADQETGPGSNGLALDAEGRLLVCDHGNRRVYRVEKDDTKTTLADRFDGKPFNSPNDLVVHSNGDIYFTDPPYGLTDESKRELDFCGVYRLEKSGLITVITKELTRPNGIALSPDEKTLYVAQSHPPAPVYQAYRLKADSATAGEGKLLFDAKELLDQGDPGLPDGMCVDVEGNLWATGPGGVLIISPEGKLLGRILLGKATANCTFGGDGSMLYITSSDRVCRVQTRTKGLGFD
jgi:gluconolactonase